jgi:hypothetical protein
MTKLEQLHIEKGKRFAEICAAVADELGYDFARIDPEDRKYVERQAEQQVSDWEETTEFRLRPIRPSTRSAASEPVPAYLRRILDEQDIEIGLWAYKKRKRARRLALATALADSRASQPNMHAGVAEKAAARRRGLPPDRMRQHWRNTTSSWKARVRAARIVWNRLIKNSEPLLSEGVHYPGILIPVPPPRRQLCLRRRGNGPFKTVSRYWCRASAADHALRG